MTDDEYNRFLSALAGKHLRLNVQQGPEKAGHVGRELERLSEAVHLLKAASSRVSDPILLTKLVNDLKESPVERVSALMDEAGILDALDDAPVPIFRGFRRSSLPPEDIEFLRRAGFSADEIEVLLSVAQENAERVAWAGVEQQTPSKILSDANYALTNAIQALTPTAASQVPERKKRKILNGIGKILGGSVAGVGNVLLVTGTIIVPAAGAAAIASGGLAVSSIFAGLGDLRGE